MNDKLFLVIENSIPLRIFKHKLSARNFVAEQSKNYPNNTYSIYYQVDDKMYLSDEFERIITDGVKKYGFKTAPVNIASIDLSNYNGEFNQLRSFISDMTKGEIDLTSISVSDHSMSSTSKLPIRYELKLDGNNLIVSKISCNIIELWKNSF